MHLKRRFLSARCLCHLESFRASRTETPGRAKLKKKLKNCIYPTTVRTGHEFHFKLRPKHKIYDFKNIKIMIPLHHVR